MYVSAEKIWRHPGLAPLLMMDAYDRICPGSFKGRRAPAVQALGRAAWMDAGYCLDAPEEMPAGGCQALETGPDESDFIPAQLVVWRGA